MGRGDPPEPFDFEAYLDLLHNNGHNFIRLWAWDSTVWDTKANGRLGKNFVHHPAPLPWRRTGPGDALDGKPKFDLAKFDPAYFDRLRSRVKAAGDRGIYVSVMLFGGYQEAGPNWTGNPFHRDNNVNGIDGDPNKDGSGWETHTLSEIPKAVAQVQKAYVRKVIDKVNHLEN